MNTKNKQKGFTLVELVIVIAVIAILAGVLIPTFSGVVEKANESAALQEAKNALSQDLILAGGEYENIPSENVTPATLDGILKYFVKIEESDKVASESYYQLTKENDNYTASSYVESEQGTKQDCYKLVEGKYLGKYSNGNYEYTTKKGIKCAFNIEKNEWKFE